MFSTHPNIRFHKNLPAGAGSIHVENTHKANSHFLWLYEHALK